MIQGIGTDVTLVARFKSMLERGSSLEHILSTKEIKELAGISMLEKRVEFLASRFAAKEAIYKATSALGLPFSMAEITIEHDDAGAPKVSWSRFKDAYPASKIMLSLAHEELVAIAFVVIEVANK